VSNRRMVTRHGKTFEVETLDFEPSSPKRRRASIGQRFAMLTEERLKLLAKVGPRFSAAWPIYCYLLMVNWKDLRQPVKLTNEALAELGISRDAKARALLQLERVGLIKVKRAGRQAPIVTPMK
jgi:hypothetical protein